MKNLITKKSARIAAAALAATVTFGAMAFALSYKPAADSYTIASEDGGYYSETTYYLTEEAFGEYESGKQAGKPAAKTMSASAKNTSESEQESGEFVMGVAKSVWVMEELDEDDNVVDSQLLTKDEMDDYGISTMGVKRPWFDQVIIGGGGDGSTKIGSDKLTNYKLTIELTVRYYSSSDTYNVIGSADWILPDNNVITSPECTALDFLGITWGGNGALKAKESGISGLYSNSQSVNFVRKNSDSYGGYVWQFFEQTANGYAMNYALANVILEKTDNGEGGETNAKLTYIHTYEGVSVGTSIQGGSSGFAGSVTINTVDRTWQIEIDVPEINY